ncbi:permease prefix domain 1-containing protein [Bariatricus sp. SGI.154]|uniref:permease prefix domain 1-containing protein n=1 Tax=Bariatricus sp. SGI.154 TaxID=3420549 RepID=UPI003D084D13
MKKEEYLKTVTEQIRCEKARSKIAREIGSHIEEQKSEYMREGLKAEEAEAEAVKDMGDPVETGTKLDMIHRPRMAWGWIGLIAALYLAGFVVQILMQRDIADFLGFDLMRYAVRLVLGLGVMVGICYVDYSRIGCWAKEITLIAFAVIYIGLFRGQVVNGAVMGIYGIHVNVRMLAFLFVPLYGAVLYQYRGQGYKAIVKGILWMFPALEIARRIPSLITVWTLFLSFVIILSFAIYKEWFQVSKRRTMAGLWCGMILIPVMGCVFILVRGAEYQTARIQAYLNPWSEELAFPTMVTRELLKNSSLIGMGNDVERYVQMLPDPVNYSFIYIVSCGGILAAIVLVGAIIFLLLRFLGSSLKQKNQMGMTMGIGCAIVMLVQMVFYILGNIGFSPMGGMYCPFITYGGTGMLVTNVLLGILLSIYRYQDVPLETEKRKYHISINVKKSG